MKKNPHNTASAGVDTNIWSPIIRGVIVIVLGVGSFILWAVQAPLDAGVVADGTVTVSSNRKTIQHLSGGREPISLSKKATLLRKIRSSSGWIKCSLKCVSAR